MNKFFIVLLAAAVSFGALVSPVAAQLVYGVDSGTDQLFQINRNTGAATAIGPLGLDIGAVGIDFDENGVLWGLLSGATVADALFTINLATGAATHVIDVDRTFSGRGIAWYAGTLYCTDGGAQELYTVNAGTGVSSLVGATGVGSMSSLTSTPSGVFYAIAAGPTLMEVDETSGATIAIGPTAGAISNCAYDVATDRLLSTVGGELREIDPSDGSTTTVGPMGMSGALPGLAVLPAATPTRSSTWGALKTLWRR